MNVLWLRDVELIYTGTPVMSYKAFHGNKDSSRYQNFQWNSGNHVPNYMGSRSRRQHDYISCDLSLGSYSYLNRGKPIAIRKLSAKSLAITSCIKMLHVSTLKGHHQARMCERLVVDIWTLHFHDIPSLQLFVTMILLYYNYQTPALIKEHLQ